MDRRQAQYHKLPCLKERIRLEVQLFIIGASIGPVVCTTRGQGEIILDVPGCLSDTAYSQQLVLRSHPGS